VTLEGLLKIKGGNEREMFRNRKAQMSASTVVTLTVAFLLVAILTPIAMNEIAKYNSTSAANWQGSVLTIFTILLPIIFIIGVAIKFIPSTGATKMFKRNIKGGVNANLIIMMAVGFLLVAIMAPIALNEIANTTTTDWNASVVTIFTILLPIIFIIGIAIRYVPRGT